MNMIVIQRILLKIPSTSIKKSFNVRLISYISILLIKLLLEPLFVLITIKLPNFQLLANKYNFFLNCIKKKFGRRP